MPARNCGDSHLFRSADPNHKMTANKRLKKILKKNSEMIKVRPPEKKNVKEKKRKDCLFDLNSQNNTRQSQKKNQ